MPVVGSQPADTALASPTADVINGVYNELLVVQLQGYKLQRGLEARPF